MNLARTCVSSIVSSFSHSTFSQGLVTRALDAQGVLAKLKAEIRSHVFAGAPMYPIIDCFALHDFTTRPLSLLIHPSKFSASSRDPPFSAILEQQQLENPSSLTPLSQACSAR
jgi:hypothetical protein